MDRIVTVSGNMWFNNDPLKSKVDKIKGGYSYFLEKNKGEKIIEIRHSEKDDDLTEDDIKLLVDFPPIIKDEYVLKNCIWYITSKKENVKDAK